MYLSRLRQAPVAVKFVTNTTKECKRILFERLRRLNFDLQEQEIFTSLTAARNLLEQRAVRPLLLVEDSALEDFTGQRLVHLYSLSEWDQTWRLEHLATS